jgi:uncharacterized Zn-binding protein involved in type VI secretion
MPFRSEDQRRWMWANKPKMARKWTEEHGSTPVKAKKGKFQDFKHPQHDILPLEHMEESVSSKERVERLLEERKKKKESKKVVKGGQGYVPGWKPNLSVKAAEGELVRQKTQGTGAAIKGIEHYTMKGMPTAQAGELIQTPTRGTGAAVKGTDHYVMEGMDAAKTGKMIKAKESKWITKKDKYITKKPIGERESEFEYKKTHQPKESKYITKKQAGGPIKAKKGMWTKAGGAATDMYDKPPGWDVKKISDKTHKKLTKLWKHREAGGWSPAAGKRYREHLKGLKAMTTKAKVLPPALKSKSFHFKDAAKASDFLHRRMTLAGGNPGSALSVLKKVGRRTGIGKAVAAATVVAGAYEAGKRKLFTKDKKKKKKTIDKKSIGGETVVMKSGGGYIDDLL